METVRSLTWLREAYHGQRLTWHWEVSDACKRKRKLCMKGLLLCAKELRLEVRGVLQKGHLGNDLHDGVEIEDYRQNTKIHQKIFSTL